MMQPSHSIVSVAMPPGSREPVTITPGLRGQPRESSSRSPGYGIFGMETIGVPGGGAKNDAGGLAVYPPAWMVIVEVLVLLDDPCE
jgi:hypothetical protein